MVGFGVSGSVFELPHAAAKSTRRRRRTPVVYRPRGHAVEQKKNDFIRNLLIGLGIFVVVGGIAFAALLLWLQKKAVEIGEEAADGGLVLVSPPEVVNALANEKKDYVGHWVSDRSSTLDIDPQGNLKFHEEESRGSTEEITAPIAAFHGDDIEIRAILKLKIAVTEAPHQVDGRWEMTAKGVKLHR